MSNYPEKVYLNDKIVDSSQAKISVFDRGFLFGDGIYEVMIKLKGNFFYAKEHLDRLNSCLEKINIDFDVSIIPDKIDDLLEATKLEQEDCLIYIQITRGVAPRTHHFPKNAVPTLMMYALRKQFPEINQNRLKIISLPDQRWHRCDIKMVSLLGNVMANDQAIKQASHEAILIRNKTITEGSHSNIFFVKNEVVYTHPANEFILDGITRQIVIQLCKDLAIELRQEGVSVEKMKQMDEAFLTGTTTQIASIQQIDDHVYYRDNGVGVITRKLQEAFLKLKYQQKP